MTVPTLFRPFSREPLPLPPYPLVCMDCDRTDALAYVRTHHQRYLCMGCYNALAYDPHSPYVSLVPGRCGGRPTLNNTGLLVEVIADYEPEHVCANYDITEADAEMARWFQRTWQLRRRRGSQG